MVVNPNRLVATLVVVCAAARVTGHGMITFPASRVGGTLDQAAERGDMDMQTFANASWFTQQANIPGPATNCGPKYVTGIPCGARDAKQPWRAPGTSPVYSPCGAFCYNDDGGANSASGCVVGEHYDKITDGRDLPKSAATQWRAGGTAKVAFTALFNHGGGYAYRLCPAGEDQTEACFQKTPLDFATETTTVHWTHGREAHYPAVTKSNGTFPPGSQWRTIRIPSCSTTYPSICGDELLPRPCPTCCAHYCDRWHFSLMDEVKVPAELPAGDYTLSWRWDAEINHQVWQGCADIKVV